MINVQFINNDGAGFTSSLEVREGTTAEALFLQQLGSSADPGAYNIRVNRERVSRGQVLQNGDRMTVMPTKIQGA